MMKFMRKTKGSISIFLLLVLLPMVTYATLVIDTSRIEAAKTLISGAGELSLNAGMSEYNQVLQDMYGLFAQVNDQEGLEKALQKYFQETVTGQLSSTQLNGDDKKYVEKWSKQLVDEIFGNNGFDENSVTNLLQMQVENFESKGVDGATLANPAVMKSQIIDYMKYRGPVSVANTLLRKLDLFSSASKQADVATQKIEYTQKVKEIEDPCIAAYYAIAGDPTVAKVEDSVLKNWGLDEWGYKSYTDDFNKLKSDLTIDSALKKTENYYAYAAHASLLKTRDHIDFPKYNDLISSATVGKLAELKSKTDYTNAVNKQSTDLASAYDKLKAIRNLAEAVITLDPNNNAPGEFESRYGDIAVNQSTKTVTYNKNKSEANCYLIQSALIRDTEKIDFTQYIYVSDSKMISPNSDKLEASSFKGANNDEKLADAMKTSNNIKQEYNGRSDTFETFMAYCLYYKDLNAKYEEAWRNFKEKYDKASEEQAKELAKNDKNNNKLWGLMSKNEQDAYIAQAKTEGIKYLDNGVERTITEKKVDEKDTDVSYERLEISGKDISLCSSDLNDNYLGKTVKNFIKALTDNQNYDLVSQYYERGAWASLYYIYYHVCKCAKTAGTVCKTLDAVMSAYGNAETAKGYWQDKINAVDDGSTKDTLQADLQSTTIGLDKDAISDMQGVAKECKTYFETLKGKIEGITYLGTQLMQNTKLSIAKNDEYNKFVTDVLQGNKSYAYPNFTDNDAYTTFSSPITLENAKTFVKNNYSCNLKPNDFVRQTNLNGTDELSQAAGAAPEIREERLFKSLESIAKPKKTQLSHDSSQKMEAINTLSEHGDNETPKTDVFEKSDKKNTSNENNSTNADPQADVKGGEFSTYSGLLNEIKKYGESIGNNNSLDEGNEPQGVKASTNKDDYGDSAENAKNSVSNSSNILKSIGDLAKNAVQNAYLEEYFTENFTCQTDPVKIKDNPDSWQMLNGYTVNKKFEGDTEYVNQKNEWFGKEIEYILWGDSDIDKNVVKTELLIYTIRFAFNVIYAFTASDIQSFAAEIATAVAGWTVVGVPIVQACITVGLALAESGYDLYQLKQGRDLPIFKSKETFVCSPTYALKAVAGEFISWGVDTLTETAEEKLNNAIDGAASKGKETFKDVSKDVSEYLKSKIEEERMKIEEEIVNTFVNPLVNKVNTVMGQYRNDIQANAVEAMEKAITETFEYIKGQSTGDSIVAQCVSSLANNTEFQNNVKEVLTDYVKEQFEKTSPENTIRQKLVGDKEHPGVITKGLQYVDDKINKEIDAITTDMQTAVNNCADKSAASAKTFVNEQLQKYSAKLKTDVKSSVAEKLPGSGAVNYPSVSKCLTLNYKEYCKIFVLLQLVGSNESNLLSRAAVLMQANVQNAAVNADSSFKITDANTLIYVSADVKIGTMFPWGVSVESNETGSSISPDMSSIGKHEVTIHYTGVNGY